MQRKNTWTRQRRGSLALAKKIGRTANCLNHSSRLCRSLAKPSHCRTNPDPSTIRNTILKTYKIYTGAHRCAPCRSTFRNTPLPLPRTHPITLTPDTGAAPDAAISLRFCGQTHGLAHIMGIDDTGTIWRDCRLGWRSGRPKRDFAGRHSGHKNRAPDCSRTLKNTM